jgi:hypothetical protein
MWAPAQKTNIRAQGSLGTLCAEIAVIACESLHPSSLLQGAGYELLKRKQMWRLLISHPPTRRHLHLLGGIHVVNNYTIQKRGAIDELGLQDAAWPHPDYASRSL